MIWKSLQLSCLQYDPNERAGTGITMVEDTLIFR